MFDVGWQELALTAVVALVVLGPKELPGLMRTAGTLVRKARLIAHDFRMNMEDMADEIELDEFEKKARAKAEAIEPPIAPQAVQPDESAPNAAKGQGL